MQELILPTGQEALHDRPSSSNRMASTLGSLLTEPAFRSGRCSDCTFPYDTSWDIVCLQKWPKTRLSSHVIESLKFLTVICRLITFF